MFRFQFPNFIPLFRLKHDHPFVPEIFSKLPRRLKINEKPYLRDGVYLYYLNSNMGAHYECFCYNKTMKIKITRNTNSVDDENAFVEWAFSI